MPMMVSSSSSSSSFRSSSSSSSWRLRHLLPLVILCSVTTATSMRPTSGPWIEQGLWRRGRRQRCATLSASSSFLKLSSLSLSLSPWPPTLSLSLPMAKTQREVEMRMTAMTRESLAARSAETTTTTTMTCSVVPRGGGRVGRQSEYDDEYDNDDDEYDEYDATYDSIPKTRSSTASSSSLVGDSDYDDDDDDDYDDTDADTGIDIDSDTGTGTGTEAGTITQTVRTIVTSVLRFMERTSPPTVLSLYKSFWKTMERITGVTLLPVSHRTDHLTMTKRTRTISTASVTSGKMRTGSCKKKEKKKKKKKKIMTDANNNNRAVLLDNKTVARKSKKKKKMQDALSTNATTKDVKAATKSKDDRTKKKKTKLTTTAAAAAAARANTKKTTKSTSYSSSSPSASAATTKHLTKSIKASSPNYRIQRELKDFLTNPPPNLRVTVGSNIRVWIIHLKGTKGSPYENETYRLRVSFPPDYPSGPPSVYFLPPTPRHEHVYTNGDICLSLLGKDWRPTLTVSSLANSILSILSGARSKGLPMDNARHAGNKPGGRQDDWIYHDDNC